MSRLQVVRRFDPALITTVLCDADGNLFPSEEPAFDASAQVTNRFLVRFGVPEQYTADQLRKSATGRNFRTTAVDFAVLGGVPIDPALASGRPYARIATSAELAAGHALGADELEEWVALERRHVTARLVATLRPDSRVQHALGALAARYALAAVSSSASARLDACFTATGLDDLIPAELRFSAEDSLPVPTSKPHPAAYLHTAEVLDIHPDQGLAVEDSVAGVRSAVAAGFVTIGNLMYVPNAERGMRSSELVDAGASAIADSWSALTLYLLSLQASAAVSSRFRAASTGSRFR
ncbi:HAD family hydrolase [Mycobacterium asiaticum]|uniref:HAD family hydrolase n=1 Tax=Mycobacterium asiaticum TaxID=1790 RepID=UPI0020A3B932|nr:HAD family phosphatase [Mycobacterium asiaticum]